MTTCPCVTHIPLRSSTRIRRRHSQLLWKRRNADGATVASLVKYLNDESLRCPVVGIEEQDVIGSRRKDAPQPLWHFLEADDASVQLEGSIRANPQHEGRRGVF